MAPIATGQYSEASSSSSPSPSASPKKRCVVVGFGMVGVSFVEKLLKYDLEGQRDQWEVTVIGEEPHIAYNRVGLTTYFEQRNVEALYLNPLEWYSSHTPGKLAYHTSDPVVSILSDKKEVLTAKGLTIPYDVCVLATGSDAALPPYVTKDRFHRTQGAFVYRNLADLDAMISYSEKKKIKRAAVVGGGLLGLEAAHALLNLETVDQAVIVERNNWCLSRQLDAEGGTLVLEKVKALGVEVLLRARVKDLITTAKEDGSDVLTGIALESGEPYDLDMIVFAVGIKPRDELSKSTGLEVSPRGGFTVTDHLQTNLPDVYAIGEAASYKGETYGLIAPGVEMADVLAFNLTEGPHHALRSMTPPDLSTKLKLMGVDVASFGDFFADQGKITRPLPKERGTKRDESTPPKVKALTYRDPFSDHYKKYIFTEDGKYLLGGMMVGDCKDYVKLVSICNKQKALEIPPSQLILGAKKEGEEEGDDLDDDAQVCSCHNTSKGDIVKKVKDGCRAFGEIKSTTKCGTGCGGCVPLATSIFNKAMKDAGAEVSNALCPHFKQSRPDLYTIVKFKKLKTFRDVMESVGKKPDSLGCEVCRPAVGSILSLLYNEWIMAPQLRQTQDTNDRFMANLQRDGSYSVVPRLVAGEVTPYQLKVLGEVAEDFSLYSKITGGQRIDLFGAKKQDLPAIWERLVAAGFQTGQAYGKSLRTVKSCVGSTWCRFGVGDSVGLAVELEQRYKGIRAPHKFKGGMSGCVRECAEAQSKDFGVIATPKGWNVYVGGNGGAKPRHADLLAEDVPKAMAVKLIDRFLILYARSADKLMRTARWIEAYPGGIKELREVIVKDKLGICKELEDEMDELVGTFHCEWTETVKNPERRKVFRQFVNTEETQEVSEKIVQRSQRRPADWPESAPPLKFDVNDIVQTATWEWRKVCKYADLDPSQDATSSAVVKYGDTQIAIFSIPGRGLRASQNMCPHRRAFVLADGLIGEDSQGRDYISCPLHKRNYTLSHKVEEDGGHCNDPDYQIMTFEAKVDEEGDVVLRLPDSDSLDAVLSTTKWMLRKAKEESDILAQDAKGSSIEIEGPSKVVEKEAQNAQRARRGLAEVSEKQQKASCGETSLDW
ncbi:putative nitrite reductase [Jaminaea rosea]|uniref:Putative nitrite reductase n=1 Tax=Jaminaea rosea TaxID=1569628 RepID=A0A316UR86_9BASI|nr:putative nitrite reductase [Jaminaea rosea]PWN25645.1 putative nitrite reductase [Jaminaea rosea]